VFTGIHPEKSMYRRYRIKTVQGIDDYRMMEEVVGRRLRRLKENNKLPDLILIDGGIGQVRSAVKVAQELGLSLPIFGLAKRFEEIYNKDGKVVSLPKDSSALRLLQRIRDEAHRFAVSYHRKLRDKLSSILDEIPGIGEKRRNILMSHFGSVERMKNLTEDEIATAPGIGKKYASMVNSFLKEIYQ
jgi:excinuclease ABC subunit C